VKSPLPRFFALLLSLGLAGSAAAQPLVIKTTLPQARQDLARLKSHGELPIGGVVLEIAPGTHALSETLALAAADSGTEESPVTWRASTEGEVILSGGLPLSGWEPVTDEVMLDRLPAVSRGQVRTLDLRAMGITNYGTIEQRGSPGIELFFHGRRMPNARFPNEGWLLIKDVPQTGEIRYNEGLAREERVAGIPVGRHYGRFTYAEDEPNHWAPSDDIYVQGYFVWDWYDSFQRIESIDRAKQELTLAAPHHRYGYAHNQRYRFINVLEELDTPGEWWIDRTAGHLYFYPPGKLGDGDVTVSLLDTPLVTFTDVEHVTLEGFTYEHGRSSGVTISGGSACQVVGSTFRELGGLALGIHGGHGHVALSNDFYHLAVGAIHVEGGDRTTITPSGHRIINNHIHHISEWLRSGQNAIYFAGVGQYLAHNLIHDLPFEAFRLLGNDHLLEYNEVHTVCTETGDAGALHTGRDYTWQGNVIRYNYWHDLVGDGAHGVTAVYLDDFGSGFQIYGNLFHRAGKAIQLGGGRHNTVRSNVLIDSDPGIHIDARGKSWAEYYFNGGYPWLFERFAELNADQPPYTDRYPLLATILQDDPAMPKGNLIEGNIGWGSGRWIDVYDYHIFDFHETVTMRDNYIATSDLMQRRTEPDEGYEPYYLDSDTSEGYTVLPTDDDATRREFPGNILSNEAPASFDPVTRTLTYHDLPALRQLGFRPVPLDRMGLFVDQWRTTLPPSE
jgi:hypothetical protein